MNLFQLVESDYKKYKKYGGNFFVILFLTQGFWAIFQYRIASFVYRNVKIIGIRQVLLFGCLLWQKTIEILTGISLPASIKIGGSFYIGHFGGIILNSKTIMGNNCNLSQGVTIGVSGLATQRGVPSIGDNVYIGANATVVGKITIGNNVLIGANTFVNSNVLDNGVVLGVPAIRISDKGSEGYI